MWDDFEYDFVTVLSTVGSANSWDGWTSSRHDELIKPALVVRWIGLGKLEILEVKPEKQNIAF